jgi:hypothetical protein
MVGAAQLHELDEGATATKAQAVKYTNFPKLKIN